MIPISPIARLALLQSLVIVIGVLTTCMILKLNLSIYKESSVDWNPVAVAVRNFGFLLLIIPAAWAGTCVALEHRRTNFWNSTRTLISGIAIITILIGFFWWTTENPYFYRHEMMGTM